MPDYSIRYLNDGKALFLQEEDYVGEIKGGLRPTMRLVVMGIVHKQPKRFVSDTYMRSCLSTVTSAHPEWLGSLRMRRAFTAVTVSQLYQGLNRFNVFSSHRSKIKHGCQQRTLHIELILNVGKHSFNCNITYVYLCVYIILVYVLYVFSCKYL